MTREESPIRDRRIGSRIGHIRIEDLIGEGGMGSVYAGWDERLERRVAVKAVSPAYRLNPQARARFLSEARILSKLHHPHICQIHELLETDEDGIGGDHLVLELIEGRSLRHVLREDETSPSRKMEIARQLVDGLSAAHEKGIVHRDLKPGNVMITEEGVVKVLDFGLALSGQEAAEQRSARAGLEWTESGQVARPSPVDLSAGDQASGQEIESDRTLVSGAGSASAIEGTVAYMSPEQARGEVATPASDMYSLGILLHELFTGCRAYESAPSLPAQLVRVGQAETLPAEGIDADLARLVERLKSPAPGARPSASDVAERLRWIEHKPRRRARRVAVIAFVALLTIFAVVMTYQRARIAEEADRANREAEAARQVSDFLVELFEVSNPWNTTGDVTARELLERGTHRIRGELEDQPATRARLLGTMGEVYRGLGLFDEARELFEESVELRRQSGVGGAELAAGLGNLARLESDLGNYETSETLFLEALELRREALGEAVVRDEEQASLLYWLAYLYLRKGEVQKSLDVYAQALERRRAIFGESSLEVAETLGDLGLVHQRMGDLDAAEDHQLRALEIRRELLPEDHVLLGISYANLGTVYYLRGEAEEAAEAFRRDLEIAHAALGPNHPDVAVSHNNLGAILRKLGRLKEAEPHYRRSLEIRRQVLGDEHDNTGKGHLGLGNLYRLMGRTEEARSELHRAVEILRQTLGEEHSDTSSAYFHLALTEEDLGRFDEALEHARRSVEIRQSHYGADHFLALDAMSLVVSLELNLGRPEAARTLARKVLAEVRSQLAETPGQKSLLQLLVTVQSLLADAAEALDEPQRARQLREEALERTRAAAESSEAVFFDLQMLVLLLELDRPQEAEEYMRELRQAGPVPDQLVDEAREAGVWPED